MRALSLLFVVFIIPAPAFATFCADQIRVGQWYTKKQVTPELLDALVGRRINVADTRESFDGTLLAASRGPDEIILRLLTNDDLLEDLVFSVNARRGYPRVEVRGEIPALIVERDAAYPDRRVEIKPEIGFAETWRARRPIGPVRLVYLESAGQDPLEIQGTVESLTPKLRVRTTNGTHTLDPRRVLRLYL